MKSRFPAQNFSLKSDNRLLISLSYGQKTIFFNMHGGRAAA